MNKNNTEYSLAFVLKYLKYYTRLVFILSSSVFIFALYYHNIPLLISEDNDARNATNQFILLNRDKKFQRPIQTSFYNSVPISSALFLFLIDVLGRKTILENSLRVNLVFVGLAGVSLSPHMLILADLCMGLNFSSALISAFLVLTECTQDSLKRLLTSFLFMAWGLSEFFAGFYYSLRLHWKVLMALIFLANSVLLWAIGRFFESPEYLRSLGREKESEEAADGISRNLICDNEVDIWDRLKRFKYKEYFLDFGKEKRFLVVLWFNAGLVYNGLCVADIKLSESIYNRSMIKGGVLTLAMSLVVLIKKFDYWKTFELSVIVSRASLFLLNLAEPGEFMSKLYYCVSSMALIYEIYSVFIISDKVIGTRAKAKMFGFLIFLSLSLNFVIKETILPKPPSTLFCMWISLFSLTSLVALSFLRSKAYQIQDESLLPRTFELTPIVS